MDRMAAEKGTGGGTGITAFRVHGRICALIALSFLWTGCGYLSWMYRLTDFYSDTAVNLLTEVVGYLFQAAGVFAFSLGEKRFRYLSRNQYSFLLLTVTGYILCCLASLPVSGPVALVFGYGMNLIFGMIAACYLTMLSVFVRPKHAGLVFGSGYGISSIASYLLSLPGGGTFLRDPRVFLVYFVAAAAAVRISLVIRRDTEEMFYTAGIPAPAGSSEDGPGLAVLGLAGITVLLLSCVEGGGFFFPVSDMLTANINLEFSRAFYAAGLILAGFINDRKRSAGAVLCIAALVFPFFSLTAGSNADISFLLWILGYTFFGFYAVYRVLLFADLARSGEESIHLAPLGLLWGRIGDAAGSTAGILLSERTLVLITGMAFLFVLCIFLFFNLYHILYMKPAAVRDDVRAFASDHDLSQRELDILRLLLTGSSNKEIAERLFISENTVKFHVRNLLRKTGCSRRKDLQALYGSYLESRR